MKGLKKSLLIVLSVVCLNVAGVFVDHQVNASKTQKEWFGPKKYIVAKIPRDLLF